MSDSHDPSRMRLREDAAQRLLARAVELDTSRAAEISIAQLRDAARQAGISPAAFDAALDEVREALAQAATPAPALPSGAGARIRRWMRAALRAGETRESGSSPPGLVGRARVDGAVANVATLAAFWAITRLLAAVPTRPAPDGWAPTRR